MARRAETPSQDLRAEHAGSADRPMQAPSNGSAVAALVTGLLAASFAFLLFAAPAAVLFGIAATILGIVGVRRANQAAGLHKGIAITGLVSGVLGLLLGIGVIVGGISLANQVGDDPQVQQQIEDAVEGIQGQ